MTDPVRALIEFPPSAVAAASTFAERTLADRAGRTLAVSQTDLTAGRVLVVDQSDPAAYKTITEAVDAARHGDRVLVRPGRYHESVVIDKAVSVEGDGDRDHILVVSPDEPCFIVSSDGARVAHLTLTGECFVGDLDCDDWQGETGRGSALWVRGGASPTIEDNEVFATGHFGVEVAEAASDPLVRGNTVHQVQTAGMWIHSGASPVVIDNEFYRCCSGIDIVGTGSDPVVRGNTVHDAFVGMTVWGGASPTIESNHMRGIEWVGLEVRDSGSAPLVRNNTIRDGQGRGIVVMERGAAPTIEKNDIHGNEGTAIWVCVWAAPVIRGNSIRDGNESGIYVDSAALPIIESNDVVGQGRHGIEVRGTGTDPLISGNSIHNALGTGIRAYEGAAPTIEFNTVYGNAGGDIDVTDAGGEIVVRNNKVGT